MLNKISSFISALVGTVTVLITLVIMALIGVVVLFVGYFLLWGIIGVFIIAVIWFLISSAIDEFKTPHDSDDPGP